jgi:hypothetical protein
MTEIIDQEITFRLIRERIANTTNPRHLTMLKRLLVHAQAESVADIDAVMATLCTNPVYRAWGSPAAMNPEGRDAVRTFYDEEVVKGGKFFFEFDLDRIVVDDFAIVTEGTYRSVYWGRDAQAAGFLIQNPDGFYLLHLRMLIVWPYDDDGFIVGEESYSAITRPDFLEEIQENQLPAVYRAYLQQRLTAA